MKIKEVINVLENWSPLSLQESYDNCGLLVGDAESDVNSALLTLDVTEEVVNEALVAGIKLIIAHHPILFKGIKKLTGKTYTERVVMMAVKHDIAIYAIHTNLDNHAKGVNLEIAKRLGLTKCEILRPAVNRLRLLKVYVPEGDAEKLRNGLFAVGAGAIGNYSECSFNYGGEGSFKPNEKANPTIGSQGNREWVKETAVEVIFEEWKTRNVLSAMRKCHPYEEVAHQVFIVENPLQTIGSGMIGMLPQPVSTNDFLASLKQKMNVGCLKHTKVLQDKVRKIAFCGGSGSFLLEDAIAAGADIFVSADFTYHRFFDAEERILIADIGHYESEQFTPVLLLDFLKEKMPTFAPQLSKVDTNPIKYF